MIQVAFVNMENMFDLLDEKAEVRDVPNAPLLNVKDGEVEFKDVHFHYVERLVYIFIVFQFLISIVLFFINFRCFSTIFSLHALNIAKVIVF